MKTEIVEDGIRTVRRDSLKTGDFFRLPFTDTVFRACRWMSGHEVGYGDSRGGYRGFSYTQVDQTAGLVGKVFGDTPVIRVYPVEPMQFTYTPSN